MRAVPLSHAESGQFSEIDRGPRRHLALGRLAVQDTAKVVLSHSNLGEQTVLVLRHALRLGNRALQALQDPWGEVGADACSAGWVKPLHAVHQSAGRYLDEVIEGKRQLGRSLQGPPATSADAVPPSEYSFRPTNQTRPSTGRTRPDRCPAVHAPPAWHGATVRRAASHVRGALPRCAGEGAGADGGTCGSSRARACVGAF